MGMDLDPMENNSCSGYICVYMFVCCHCRSMRIRLSLSLFLRAQDRELSQTRSRKRQLVPVTAIMAVELNTNLFHQQVRAVILRKVEQNMGWGQAFLLLKGVIFQMIACWQSCSNILKILLTVLHCTYSAFFFFLWPVKPSLPVQIKKEPKEERSRNTLAKRLHSDLDSDEDPEDSATKDEGWTWRTLLFFCILVHVSATSLFISFFYTRRERFLKMKTRRVIQKKSIYWAMLLPSDDSHLSNTSCCTKWCFFHVDALLQQL